MIDDFENKLVHNLSMEWNDFDILKNLIYEGNNNIGPGEEFLATLLNGTTQGKNVTYDILSISQKKYEVKSVNKSKKIRAAIEGIVSVNKAFLPIREAFDQIKNFIEFVKEYNLLNDDSIKNLSIKLKFYQENKIKNIIERGNFSKKNIQQFIEIVEEISLLKSYFIGSLDLDTFITLNINNQEINLSKKIGNYIDFISTIKKNHDIDIISSLSEDQKIFCAFSIFQSSFFDDPQNELKKWKSLVSASTVFNNVDGIFIVNKQKFLYIEKSKSDEILEFHGISNMRPNYKLKKF